MPVRMLLRLWPAALLMLAASAMPAADPAQGARDPRYWPQWRGPLSTGVAPQANPPVTWSEQKNIRWKTAVPGRGHSTPVIWDDRIFLTTAIPAGDPLPEPLPDLAEGSHDNLLVSNRYDFVVLAFNRHDGKLLWQKTVREALPHEAGHNTGSLASASPVTDGEQLFASFGSRGLYCLNLDGSVLWEKDFGNMRSKHGHGEGSSPALFGDTLIVNWDHEGQSFIVALNKRTGAQRWKQQRDEVTSWASPIVVEHAGRPQVIVSGTTRVRGYDLDTGKVIWECGGLSGNVVASPVAADGRVIAGSSYEKQAMFAIKLDGAKGDITGTEQVLWTLTRSTPYVPSPLLYGDVVYFLRHYQGILSRVNTATGKDDGGPFRLAELRNIYASPVGAAGRIYVTSREGLTLVMTHDANPKLLAVNELKDAFNASAALAGTELYLRGEKHLYCIAEKEKP